MRSSQQRLTFLNRISAVDGMAITAKVWNEAHQYHRDVAQRYAQQHPGAGILTGLTVVADTSPSSSVRVQPGAAIDPTGQLILVPEERVCELNPLLGMVYLYLVADESRPLVMPKSTGLEKIHYITECYRLEADIQLPEKPYIELARIYRPDRATVITDAQKPAAPAAHEVDLRHRRVLATPNPQPVFFAMHVPANASANAPDDHLAGWYNLARELRDSGGVKVWVDRIPTIAQDLLPQYPLLILVGRDRFDPDAKERENLYTYIAQGGIVFYESCRSRKAGGGSAADSIFRQMMVDNHGVFTLLSLSHELLQTPHFFARPPEAFDRQGAPRIEIVTNIGKGVVFMSDGDYACLWAGKRDGGAATRGEIRDAMEWGRNLIEFAVRHSQRQP